MSRNWFMNCAMNLKHSSEQMDKLPALLSECPAQTQPSAATCTKSFPLAIPTNHLLYPVLILTANIYEVLPR